MTALDRASSVPLYEQLEDELVRRIAGGEWHPGEQIPSENELHRAYGLSRMTVRGVITKLVERDLLRRVPGKGTFVQSGKIAALSPAYLGIREQLEEMGLAITTELVSFDEVTPSALVRESLKVTPGDTVFAIVRRRLVDDVPISLHRSFVPSALAPDLDRCDVVNEQLCVVLEKAYGIRMSRVEEELEAAPAWAEAATALEIQGGVPVLALSDVLYDGHDRPFEYSHITFRGDRFRLRFNYKR